MYTTIYTLQNILIINIVENIVYIGGIMTNGTTIAVSKQTKEKLNRLGQKGETYNDIIENVCETYEDFLEKQYKRLSEKTKFVEMK